HRPRATSRTAQGPRDAARRHVGAFGPAPGPQDRRRGEPGRDRHRRHPQRHQPDRQHRDECVLPFAGRGDGTMKRLILVGALAAAALAIGIAWPPPPVPARSAADEQWSLPEEAALTRFAAPEFSEATRKLRWSADRAGQAGAGADGALPWRLAGIAADGHSVALLMTLGKDAT